MEDQIPLKEILPTQNTEQTSTDIPVSSVKLPSLGLLYGQESVLHNVEEVQFKAMTVAEEDILLNEVYNRNGTSVQKLIEACLIDKRIKIKDLIAADFDAIITGIRISGMGNDYETIVKCNSCNKESEKIFKLNELSVKYLTERPVEEFTRMFSLKLDNGHNIIIKILNIAEEEELEEIKKKLTKNKIQIKETEMRLFKQIISINGNEDHVFIKNYISKMSTINSKKIKKYLVDISPKVIWKSDVVCDYCGVESEVRIPMGVTFLWPELSR